MQCLRPAAAALTLLCCCISLAQEPPARQETAIRLLVRADDMGAAQSINEACIRTAEAGVARSVEVIVPGPWFLDAVRLLKEHRGIDVGVHLTLTSEWERIKWRPLTHAPSLVDSDGYFLPMTSQRKDFPPGTGFLQSGYKLAEVERELRAQIELANKHLPGRISHVSTHMGTATARPELRAVTEKLAKEFGLRMESPQLKRTGRWSGSFLSPEQKEQGLIKLLGDLQPGTWLLVEHPAFDTPEMRSIAHKGYENVAQDRAGVTEAFLSPKVKDIISRRSIQLISYADLTAPEK